jgi:hypothetical protein
MTWIALADHVGGSLLAFMASGHSCMLFMTDRVIRMNAKIFLYACALTLIVSGIATAFNRRDKGQQHFMSTVGSTQLLLKSRGAGLVLAALGVILALAVFQWN